MDRSRAMSEAQGHDVSDLRIPALEQIAARGEVWERVAAKHGVTHPLPPWTSSLDGTCHALDSDGEALPLLERRREEDLLSEAVYSGLPAHSLVARGVIDEDALARRMDAVRARLAAA
jgi:hypothetical protein